MIHENPPAIPLPTDVLSLMDRTNKLVDLLYWTPTPSEGSKGAAEFARRRYEARRQKKPGRNARPRGEMNVEREFSEEMDGEDAEVENLASPSKRRKKFHWPAGMDLEARRAYGEALMSGHGVLHFVSLSPMIVRTDCLRRLRL